MRTYLLAAVAAVSAITTAAQAGVVVETLPYESTPDWTDTEFGGTSMTVLPGGDVDIETAGGGIWFGWGYYSDPLPSWSPGSNSDGNLLRMTARFGAASPDWNMYLADGHGYALMNFNPTGCDGNVRNCREAPYTPGVEFYFGSDDPGQSYFRQFVALDTSVNHDYGFLLKDGLVSYFVDGHSYSGVSMLSSARVLIIGDSSGSTHTGAGHMIVHAVSLDNAPDADVSLAVPEPATWAMTMLGFGAMGTVLRGRKRSVRFA